MRTVRRASACIKQEHWTRSIYVCHNVRSVFHMLGPIFVRLHTHCFLSHFSFFMLFSQAKQTKELLFCQEVAIMFSSAHVWNVSTYAYCRKKCVQKRGHVHCLRASPQLSGSASILDYDKGLRLLVTPRHRSGPLDVSFEQFNKRVIFFFPFSNCFIKGF